MVDRRAVGMFDGLVIDYLDLAGWVDWWRVTAVADSI